MVIERAVEPFATHQSVAGVYVGIAPEEQSSDWLSDGCCEVSGVFEGAATRSQTVLNGLNHMIGQGISEDDWALVHDSNRPFLQRQDIDAMIEEVGNDPNGGVMCVPVHDTVKQSHDGHVAETLSREKLYRAQTPQMFKIGSLAQALQQAIEDGVEVTDESQAMERQGMRPRIVPGRPENIKLTTPDDWAVADALLRNEAGARQA